MPPYSLDGEFESGQSTGLVSITTNGVTTAPGDFALAAAAGDTNTQTLIGAAPDGSWAAFGPGWWKSIPGIGPLSVTQALAGNQYDAVQALVLLKTSGVPVITPRGSGSGGGNVVPSGGSFTPNAAGNALLWIGTDSNPNPPSVVNAAGLNWTLLSSIVRHSVDGGFDHYAGVWIYYAENIPKQVLAPQLNIPPSTWFLAELSNVLLPPRLLASLGGGN